MQQNIPRKSSKKQQNSARATGCFTLITLVVLIAAVLLVLQVLDTPAYSGWSTTMKDNPYSPEDFITVGGYVTCTAGPTRRGIDVSTHQERIDWEKVRGAGFDFAFIRIGYRGYSVGEIFPDERARENLKNARAAGFDVGVYFYSQAIDIQEAREEAQWCLDFLAGEKLDLPVVYDWEYVSPSARTGGMDRETLTECAKTFCTAIENGGYQPMVYFNKHVSQDLLNLDALSEYPFWLAQYKDEMDYPHQVDFWQYTEEGSVPGIEGDVDIDLMFIYE